MILLVLFIIVVGMALVIAVAWWLTQAMQHLPDKIGITEKMPSMGTISLASPFFGAICLMFGAELRNNAGAIIAMVGVLIVPALGGCCGVAAFVKHERPSFIQTLGLLGNALFVVLFWGMLLNLDD